MVSIFCNIPIFAENQPFNLMCKKYRHRYYISESKTYQTIIWLEYWNLVITDSSWTGSNICITYRSVRLVTIVCGSTGRESGKWELNKSERTNYFTLWLGGTKWVTVMSVSEWPFSRNRYSYLTILILLSIRALCDLSDVHVSMWNKNTRVHS